MPMLDRPAMASRMRAGARTAGQARGSHELTPAHQEQGPRHDPPIGSGVASQHADRLPDRAVGGRLDRAGDGQPPVATTGDRPAETTAHPGTGRRGRSGHVAGPASRRTCRRVVPASGSSASLPGWPGRTRVMSASLRVSPLRRGRPGPPPGRPGTARKQGADAEGQGADRNPGQAPGTRRSRARPSIVGPGRGARRGLDARAGSRRPSAVVLGCPGALVHGQDNRYETGTDGGSPAVAASWPCAAHPVIEGFEEVEQATVEIDVPGHEAPRDAELVR